MPAGDGAGRLDRGLEDLRARAETGDLTEGEKRILGSAESMMGVMLGEGDPSGLLLDRLFDLFGESGREEVIFADMDPAWTATLVGFITKSCIDSGVPSQQRLVYQTALARFFQLGHDYALRHGDIRKGSG